METPIIWENTSRFWGKSVSISTANNGNFSLTEGICGDPRVFSDGMIISSIFPNPAKDIVEIQINAEDEYAYDIVCYNQLGYKQFTRNITLSQGTHSIPFSVKELQSGMYMIHIEVLNSSVVLPLFIAR